MDWMLMPLRRYADFSGRSRRKEYWMFALGVIVVSIGLMIVSFMMFGGSLSASDLAGPSALATMMSVFIPATIFGLAVLIPSIAVIVRRFHDQNRSGWFAALAYGPQLLTWVSMAAGSVMISGISNFVGMIGSLIVFVFMFFDGTPGPNRFGPDPKEGERSPLGYNGPARDSGGPDRI